MLKSILLASAVMISVPAFAQNAPAQETPAPAQQTTPPADAAEPAPAEDTSTPVDDAAEAATPAEPAAPAQPAAPSATPATPAAPAAPAQPDPAKPDQATAAQGTTSQPATATQIAQIVDKDFGTYDKDADGNLKTEDFGAWMVALRSATEPAFTGQSAQDKAWIGKAFAMADKDKSGGVSNAELKGFLAPTSAAS